MSTLTEGKIVPVLIRFTVPILFALLLQTAYGLADLLIVGQFGKVADVSGVSTGGQLMTLMTAICNGIAMGTTVAIGYEIGREKRENIPSIIKSTILIFTIFAIISMVVILGFIDHIVQLLNTPADALSQTTKYLFICALGIPMIYAYNVLGSIFRGFGDSKTPLIAVGIACVLNIVLDLILIAGFKMGSSGAAIATVVSQFLSVIICLIMIKSKGLFNFGKAKENIASYVKVILKLGIPIALQSGLISISFLAITVIVNQFGVVFSAAVGSVEKLTGIIMLVPISFMNSLSVFVAQNNTAQKYKRVQQGLFIGFSLSFFFALIMAYVSFFHGNLLIQVFSNDAEVIHTSVPYLKAYALDTLLVPIIFCLSGYFTGCGKTFFVMAQGVFGSIALRLPLTYLLSRVEPVSLFTIGLAIPLSTIVQIVIVIAYYIIYTRNMKKEFGRDFQ